VLEDDAPAPDPDRAAETNPWAYAGAAINLGAFLALLALASRGGIIHLQHDEGWYLGTAEALRTEGLTAKFLRELPGPAGPLYSFVHALFAPLTGLQRPGIRFVNMGLFAATILVVANLYRRRGLAHPLVSAMHLMAVPILYGAVGGALTDVPALLCFSACLAPLLAAVSAADAPGGAARARSLGLAVLAGACFGLAVLGRQQYLAALAALPILGLGSRAAWPALAAFAASGLAMPAAVFAVWGGLVPPHTEAVGHGISVPYGLLSFGYAGAMYSLFDARFFLRPRGLAIVVASVLVHLALDLREVEPSSTGAMLVLPGWLLAYFVPATCGALIGLGICLGVELAEAAWADRHDRELAFLWAAAFFLLLTPLKINHLFSSRYVIPALPMVLLLAERRSPDSPWKALRMAAASVLGLFSY
jgi:hypothetical protein